ELLRRVKELIAAQLVVEESDERFAFRHALTRRAVYAGLLARERKALHHLVAEAMERLYAEPLDAHLGDLAYHYSEAGVWGKALDYARRAGERAQRLYAPRAAIEQFSRALAAAEQLAPPQSRSLYHARQPAAVPASLYGARGRAYETLGDFEAARADH